MNPLKTDFKDDIFEGTRSYQQIKNDNGTYSFVDVTAYIQEGDLFGANDVNAITTAVNALANVTTVTLPAASWTGTGPYTQTVAVPGLTAEDNPLLVKVIPDGATPDQVKAYNKAFGMIDDGDTSDGGATFTCYNKKPATDLTVGLKGV